MGLQVMVLFSYNFCFSLNFLQWTFFLRQLNVEKMWKEVSDNFIMLKNVATLLSFTWSKTLEHHSMQDPCQSENCALLSDSYGEVNYSSQASPSFSVWKLNIKKRENSHTLNDGRAWNSLLTFLLNFLLFLGDKSTFLASNVNLHTKNSQVLIFRISHSPIFPI